jgi:serine/threonine-protein kinase
MAGQPFDRAFATISFVDAQRTVIGERYELLGLLGSGGMGTVYKARDLELDELVALKALRRDLVDDASALERFRREVTLARRVTHPNVARVYDIGAHGVEKFLTMEFVDGESLASLLARQSLLRLDRVTEIMTAACKGLGAVHEAGIIHRDLKPDNVLIGRDGRVVLTDFGIARGVAPSALTMEVAMGTPAYMAPEQVQGGRALDARADIYALGAMLYELLTGQRPWQGDSALAVAAARLLHEPPDPREVRPETPDPYARLVTRCMARKPEDRPASVHEMISCLASVTLPAVSVTPSSGARVRESGRWSVLPTGAGSGQKNVAVLPFKNGGPASDAYLADGLTDDLIDALSMTRGLRVRARGVVSPYREVDRDPREIGRELDVQVVVEGSIRRTPAGVRINARVIGVDDGFQLWAKRFDRPEQEMLMVNDEVARAIAEALTLEAAGPARDAPTDAQALEMYLRARVEARIYEADALERAVELLQRAAERAPDDPTILASWAMALARLSFFTGRGRDEALQVAERAVLAAPGLGEAHLALGTVRWHHGDAVGAAREARLALSRAPGLAEAHALMGRILLEVGALEDAMRRCSTALDLDPGIPLVGRELARANAMLGRWDAVDPLLDRFAEQEGRGSYWIVRARLALWRRDTGYAAAMLARAPQEAGTMIAARGILCIAAGREPEEPEAFEGLRAWTRSAGGRLRLFAAQLDAEIHAFRGELPEAAGMMGEAVELGFVDKNWFDRCPLLDGLRDDAEVRLLRATVHDRARAAADAAAGLTPTGTGRQTR